MPGKPYTPVHARHAERGGDARRLRSGRAGRRRVRGMALSRRGRICAAIAPRPGGAARRRGRAGHPRRPPSTWPGLPRMMGSPGPTRVPDPGARWTCTTWRTGPTRTDPATWTGWPPVDQERGPTRRVRSTHGAGRPWTARAHPGTRGTARNHRNQTNGLRGALTARALRTHRTARTPRALRTLVTAATARALRTGRARALRTGESQEPGDGQGQEPGNRASRDRDRPGTGRPANWTARNRASQEPGSQEPGSQEPDGPHTAAAGRTEGARVYVLGESRRRGR